MIEIDLYVQRLRKAAAECGLPQTELAQKTRLHVNTIRKIGQTTWNPSLDTLRRLDRFLLRDQGNSTADHRSRPSKARAELTS